MLERAAHDVSDEPRDPHGRWTDGGSSDDGKGKHPGAGYTAGAYVDDDGVIQTNSVYDAQRALFENRRVELKQIKQISTLVKRLGETAAEMAEQGETAPVFNLCLVSVKGTNLFCADQIGIPRVEMPVIRAGATKDFIKYLKKQGYAIEKDTEKAANLRATQNEISGVKVAAAMEKIKDRGFYKRLVVSRDDYILDGHHTWAGQLAIDAKDGKLTNDKHVKIARVDISITKLIAEAEKWTGGAGKKPASEAPKGYQFITMRQARDLLDPETFRKFAEQAYRFVDLDFDSILITVPKASGDLGVGHHNDWMDECVPQLMAYGKDQEVAVAACLNMWREAWEETHPDGKPDPGPPPPEKMLDANVSLTYAQAQEFLREWDEDKHPRVPAGGPGGGEFTSGGSGGSESSEKPKGKKPVKKEDFQKAKIKIGAGGANTDDAFIAKWNEKIGVEPEEFKKVFTGGLNDRVDMTIYESGDTFYVGGKIMDANGNRIGEYDRQLKPGSNSAYSALFKLNKSAQHSDIGKKMLAGNVEMYEKLGYNQVRVTANIDVGGYAWAKYGYVPTPSAWSSLSSELERKLDRMEGGGGTTRGRSTDTYEADSWDMIPDDQQQETYRLWARDSREEFYDSEVSNWRDGGQPLEEAKKTLQSDFNDGDNDWALKELKDLRARRAEKGEKDFPYNDEEILAALSIDEYGSRYEDGRDDPEFTWDDDQLDTSGASKHEGQLEFEGIEPPMYHKLLTDDMRSAITDALENEFNSQAESNASDIDPPDYLNDSVDEYMEEYWDQIDDRTKLRHAVNYGQADIEIESEDEDDDQGAMELTEEEKESPEVAELYDLVRGSNPKNLWKVADSSLGKKLLLNSGWSGVLDLKDKEAMARFKAYVDRAKKAA